MANEQSGSVLVSKIQAARDLLEQAIRLHDLGDYLCAIVLSGTAEDLLCGLLARQGRSDESSRQRLSDTLLSMSMGTVSISTDEAKREVVAVLRTTFNWLRHSDRDDSDERRLDLRAESIHQCMRAIDNLHFLTGEVHSAAKMFGYPVGN